MSSSAYSSNAYQRVTVETASQGKLIVMLFNGAIKFAEEGKRRIAAQDNTGAHNNLVNAQDIMSELRGALNMNAGEIAENLDRTYEYIHHLLVSANVRKQTALIDESVEHMTGIRDAWEELFDEIDREEQPNVAPTVNKHGASVMNLKG